MAHLGDKLVIGEQNVNFPAYFIQKIMLIAFNSFYGLHHWINLPNFKEKFAL